MKGFVLINRDIYDDLLFNDDPFTQREAYIWLIAEAAYTNRQIRVNGRVLELKRGQLCHSTRFLADRWQWSKDRVHRYLKKLSQEGRIETAIATGQTLITLCFYDELQGNKANRAMSHATEATTAIATANKTVYATVCETNATASNTLNSAKNQNGLQNPETALETPYATDYETDPATGPRQDRDKDITIKNKLEKQEREKGPSAEFLAQDDFNPDREPSFMWDGWQPSGEDMAFGQSRGYDGTQLADLAESFKLHFLSTGEQRADWGAAFRKWVMNDKMTPAAQSPKPPKLDTSMDFSGCDPRFAAVLNEICERDHKGVYTVKSWLKDASTRVEGDTVYLMFSRPFHAQYVANNLMSSLAPRIKHHFGEQMNVETAILTAQGGHA